MGPGIDKKMINKNKLYLFFLLGISLFHTIPSFALSDYDSDVDLLFGPDYGYYGHRYERIPDYTGGHTLVVCKQESSFDWGGLFSSVIDLGATIAPAVGAYLSNKEWAKTARRNERVRADAALRSQQALAEAYTHGVTSCNARYDAAINYSVEYGTAPINPVQLQNFCNGSPYDLYAGYGGQFGNGFGGVGNPYLAAGYSPGFLGSMAGPYAGAGGIGGSYGYPGQPGYNNPYGVPAGNQISANNGLIPYGVNGYGSYYLATGGATGYPYYNGSSSFGQVQCLGSSCVQGNAFLQNQLLNSRSLGVQYGNNLGGQALYNQYNRAASNLYNFSSPSVGGAPFAVGNLGVQFGI